MSDRNYHTTKFFFESLLAIEMRKTQILMNKAVCLGLLISDLSKTLMYKFWYDYVQSKYSKKRKNLLYGHKQFPCTRKNRWYL